MTYPDAQLEVVEGGVRAPSGPPFFPVSLTKLVVMFFCTFGLYTAFWLFSHWCYVRDRETRQLSPLLRTMLGCIFCYALFRRIRASAKEEEIVTWWRAGWLAIACIALTLLGFFPLPLGLLSVFSVLVLLAVQRTANAINAAVDPGHDTNSAFSWPNRVAIALGGTAWLLVLLRLLASPTSVLEGY